MRFKRRRYGWVALLLAAGLLLPTVACTTGSDTEPPDRTDTAATDAPESSGTAETETETDTETEVPPVMKQDITVQTDRVTDAVTFRSLPLGTVQAERWLEHQALLLAENITQDFERLSPDCKATGEDRSGWLGGTGESWERGPYYVRGLVAMAYVLNSEPLKEQAQKWIDWALESQTESGAFGPYAENPAEVDYWSLMPMLMALEMYADATGDERVLPFLQRYFDWQYEALKTRPLSSWGAERGGDNILAVYWYMEKTGDRSYEGLCELLYEQTANWESRYDAEAWSGTYHIVNIQESFKLFPILYALTGEEHYLDTYYTGLENLYMAAGRADGMSNGDEVNRDILATHGSETCAVVERMLCDEIALVLLRDASIADHLEEITYNALPQQLLPDGRGQVYFTMENQIDASLGNRGFSSDGGDRSVYGAPGGFPCCVHNYQMGWPLFIASMWMATSDGGLAVGAYGPGHVTATVGSGTRLTLTESTDYPYEDTVTLHIEADKTDTYPLYLRVPSWCDAEDVTVKVNGETVPGAYRSGAYFSLTAEWKSGDTVELTFPRRLTVEYGENNSISVRYGGVLFALALNEDRARLDYNPLSWSNKVGNHRYSSYAYTTQDDWNLVLSDLNLADLTQSLTVTEKDISSRMTFEQRNAPITITATARLMPSWQRTAYNTAGALPVSPVASELLVDEPVTVTLLPYAFTRLRITRIPWSGEASVVHTATATEEGLVFDNVIAPAARLEDVGDGTADMSYTLRLSGTLESDRRFRVLINRREVGELTLRAGESTATVSAYELASTMRNRVELIPTDGLGAPAAEDLTLTVEAVAEGGIRYEAEGGSAKGGAYVHKNLVVGMEHAGDSVVFPVAACAEAGTYAVRIYYHAPDGDATHALYIDDARMGTLRYGMTAGRAYVEMTVELPAGAHTVRVTRRASDHGIAELDAVSLRLLDAHPVNAPLVGEGGTGRIARLEAEEATLSGQCYSSGTHVSGMDHAGDSLTFTVSVPADGEYCIRSYHCAPLGGATHTLVLDGVEQGKLRYAQAQTGWGLFSSAHYAELRITLTAGEHTLTLLRAADDTGFAEVDAVDIIRE